MALLTKQTELLQEGDLSGFIESLHDLDSTIAFVVLHHLRYECYPVWKYVIKLDKSKPVEERIITKIQPANDDNKQKMLTSEYYKGIKNWINVVFSEQLNKDKELDMYLIDAQCEYSALTKTGTVMLRERLF